MKISRYLWGIILVLAGILVVVNNIGPGGFKINIWKYWPAVLILVGLSEILDQRAIKVQNIVLIGIGTILLLRNLNVFVAIDIWTLILASVLIYIGVSIIFQQAGALKAKKQNSDTDNYSRFTVLSGSETLVDTIFDFGEFTAILGGSDINLMNSDISPDGASVYARVFMGGIEITVPAGTEVIVKGFIVFGGVGQQHKVKSEFNGKRINLYISGAFGGVEIIYA